MTPKALDQMTSMPTSRILIALAILVLFATLMSIRWQFRASEPEPTRPGNAVVATVGTHTITLREVEQAVALPLYQADQQRTKLLQQALQHVIDEHLLAAEAARKGVTVSQLLADASQSEAIARLANLPAPVKRLHRGKTEDGSKLGAPRDPQEQARLRQALLVALRRQADIHIKLPEPELPILSVNTDDDPSMGPADAPVTIVEFSDFQCPYCKLSVQVIKDILVKYPGKVRVVYRDFPGFNHSHAQQAAEAAQCAAEQGYFWNYHDLLFSQQAAGQGWDFAALAKQLGLDQQPFALCLNAGRYREKVGKDLQDGLRLGVSSTPTFFVNGRPLVGAHPLTDFQALIDPLLQQ
jgi:protein-disulfide isomerase